MKDQCTRYYTQIQKCAAASLDRCYYYLSFYTDKKLTAKVSFQVLKQSSNLLDIQLNYYLLIFTPL